MPFGARFREYVSSKKKQYESSDEDAFYKAKKYYEVESRASAKKRTLEVGKSTEERNALRKKLRESGYGDNLR